MMAIDMKQLLASMEATVRLQGRARAEKRARQAECEQKEFKEKLMRVAAGQMELEGMAQKVKGWGRRYCWFRGLWSAKG